jgi:transcriptional antiterminator NusG
MNFKWFALHVLAGKEQKVRDSIVRRLKLDEMEPYIREVLLPVERVVEVRNGKKMITNRKLHPGYLYIDMALLDGNRRLMEKPWYFIKGIDGVIGFIGGERPAEVESEEIESIKAAVSDSEDAERPKLNFVVGETVKINDGPFLSFSGAIEEIEAEKGKLKVTVDIFGRKTPVELEYWQVEKS